MPIHVYVQSDVCRLEQPRAFNSCIHTRSLDAGGVTSNVYLQYREQEEHVRQLEFQVEEARAEATHKTRQVHELQQSVHDMKSQMNDVRDQKTSCENEARSVLNVPCVFFVYFCFFAHCLVNVFWTERHLT